MTHANSVMALNMTESKTPHLHSLVFPLVCERGLCDELELCADVARAELEDVTHAPEGALDAACALVELVQCELTGREGEILGPTERRELAMLHTLGIACSRILTGRKLAAKDAQLAPSGGHPLAICIGPPMVVQVGKIRKVPHVAASHGCGLVFADTTRKSGHPFRVWCDEHTDKDNRRDAARRWPKRWAEPPTKRD